MTTIPSARFAPARSEPQASIPGIVLAALSLVVMPLLARAKRKVAPVLGSRAESLADTRCDQPPPATCGSR